jgi:lysyl-tRNA synthetase class I
MTKVRVSKQINVPAKKAWEALSSFRGIENYSPIASSTTFGEGKGATRTCVLPDGAKINEILNFAEDSKMEMQYIITDGPFPITNYVSDVKVTKVDTENSNITWECEFESSSEVQEEMKGIFGGFYNVIIEDLEKYLNH